MLRRRRAPRHRVGRSAGAGAVQPPRDWPLQACTCAAKLAANCLSTWSATESIMRPPKAAALPLIDTSLMPTRLHCARVDGLDARRQVHRRARAARGVGALADQPQRATRRRRATAPPRRRETPCWPGRTSPPPCPCNGAGVDALGDLRAGHAAGDRLDVLQQRPGGVGRAGQRERSCRGWTFMFAGRCPAHGTAARRARRCAACPCASRRGARRRRSPRC